MQPQPIAHWPLATNGRDVCGRADAIAHDVQFVTVAGRPAADFGGRGYLEVPASPRLGTGDFTISAWLHTAANDAGGDLLSQWDTDTRTGLNLTLQRHTGVTCAQPNVGHLGFGLDAGTEPQWHAYGRPGMAVMICSLATYEGHLYAGTYEHEAGQTGHVYCWLGDQQWQDCGLPTAANSVAGMAVHQGQLFAGSMRYNAEGSALGKSPNEAPGGQVYRLENDGSWTDCGTLPGAAEVLALCSHAGELYAIPLYTDGVYRWDGGTGWIPCGVPGDRRAFALGTWRGDLYLASNNGPVSAPSEHRRSAVFRYAGGIEWVDCGPQGVNTQTYSLVTWQGRLYAGTWPDGSVWRYDGGRDWTHAGRMGDEREVMPLVVYNGQLYGGTLPLAQVYRYAGGTDWTLVGRLDHTPDVTYRRVWSMAVHDGRLVCGTLPSGEIHALEAGHCLTWDHELRAGWRHIGAVRAYDEIVLYVDGQLVARKPAAALDLTSDAPLRIGFGAHDHLHGALADVRLYGQALSVEEIAALAAGDGSAGGSR